MGILGAIGNRDYETTKAEIRANGTVVASIPFVYGYGASLGDEYAHPWFWDTRGFPPGKYGIRGEVFLGRDATPYDNFLALKEPVILLAPGTGSGRPCSGSPSTATPSSAAGSGN